MSKRTFLAFVSGLLLLMGGCAAAATENTAGDAMYIYYVNIEESKVVQEEYYPQAEDTTGQIQELCDELARNPADGQSLALLPEGVTVTSWEINDDTLRLDFSINYDSIETPREILIRAGIVRIFCQFDEVNAVAVTVAGQELLDSQGNEVGLLTEESFVEYSGKEVNAYQYVTITLYFTNETGDKLVKEERKIYYSKNTPLERVVVEQLVKGPKNSENHAVVPAETKIIGVSVMDRIGYVNLDKNFVDMALPIQENIAVQAIATSLVESCNVEKVQISVNGETKLDFRESISLDQFFEPDDSLKEEEINE